MVLEVNNDRIIAAAITVLLLCGVFLTYMNLNYRALTDQLLIENQNLLDQLSAPAPKHVPHDVQVDLLIGTNGTAIVVVDRIFPHKFVGACRPRFKRPDSFETSL